MVNIEQEQSLLLNLHSLNSLGILSNCGLLSGLVPFKKKQFSQNKSTRDHTITADLLDNRISHFDIQHL